MKLTSLLFLLNLLPLLAMAAPIKVEVDRSVIRANESFQITFTTTEDPDGEPDFAPLAEKFDIINTNQTHNSSWVNGVSQLNVQWIFNVMAKQSGKVQIPPIHFGSETSPALSVIVSDSPTSSDTNSAVEPDPELLLTAEVDVKTLRSYVQGQIIYTVKFYRRVQIAEASLKDPELTDAVVTKLGEDKNFDTEIKGIHYAVTERHYAIFPQKSGSLTLPKLTLTAAVVDAVDPGLGGFFGTRSTRTQRVSAQPITLEILPKPANFKGQWLVAQQLTLTQQWSGDVNHLKIGEPLTRTLSLVAQGTSIGQLPALYSNDNLGEGLKSYPDQPRLDEQKNSQGIIATREEKIAFIPAKPGQYVLAPIEIRWFNLRTQQTEIAALPAVKLTVAGSVTNRTVTPPSASLALTTQRRVISKPLAVQPVVNHREYLIWQLLTATFALAWIITMILWLKSRRSPNELVNIHQETIVTFNPQLLKQACEQNQPLLVKQALLEWAKIDYQVQSLGALATHCESALSQEILRLDQNLYSRHKAAWEGRKLWSAFQQQQQLRPKTQPKPISDSILEPLHRI